MICRFVIQAFLGALSVFFTYFVKSTFGGAIGLDGKEHLSCIRHKSHTVLSIKPEIWTAALF